MFFLLGLLSFGAAWLLPWHFLPWVTFQQELVAAVGLALMVVEVLRQLPRQSWAVPPITLLFMGIALIPVVQWSCGLIAYHIDAGLSAAYTLAFGVSIATGRSLVLSTRREEFIAGWFYLLIIAATMSVTVGLIQWLGLEGHGLVADLPPRSRVFGNLAQPNHLATLLGMGLAGVVWLYETRRIAGIGLAVSGAYLGFGLVMTQSRTGWVFVVCLLIWHALFRWRSSRRLPVVAYAASIVGFVMSTALWAPLNDAMLLTPAPDVTAKLTPGLRLIHWGTVVDALAQSPLIGFGWGQVTHAQTLTAVHHPATGEGLMYSHNVILDLMAWNGVPLGALIAISTFGYFVLRAWRCESFDSWAILAAAGAILLHAQFEFPHAYTFFLLPLGLMMGAAHGLEPDRATAPRFVQIPLVGAWSLLAAGLAFLTWTSVEYVKVEEASRQVRMYLLGIVMPSGEPEPAPDVILLDQPREYHRFWITPARQGLDAATLDWMHDVTFRRPVPPGLMRYAIAAGLNGRSDEAEHSLRILCHVWGLSHCVQGRVDWARAVETHPNLRSVRYPDDPPEASQAHRGR